jgi:hypothetical protein
VEAKDLPGQGIDPSTQNKLDRTHQQQSNRTTFLSVAEHRLEMAYERELADTKLRQKMWHIEILAVPLSKRLIADVTPVELLGLHKRTQRSSRYLRETGIEKIFDHNSNVSKHLISRLQVLGTEVSGPNTDADIPATVGVRFSGKNNGDFAETLKQADLIASLRRDVIRLSPRCFNTVDDIDQAPAAIKVAL